jgi:plasmid stability protein
MGDLLIRNISDALKRDISARAEKNGNSLSDEAKNLLQKAIIDTVKADVPTKSAWEAMREIFAPKNGAEAREAEEYAKIMDEIEAKRKKDFGRPFEGME